MKKQIFYVATAAALLALGSCTDRSREFDACGQIEATEVLVSAEANGRIIALQVTEGDKLTAGEVVGVIDSVQTYLQKEELVRKRSNTQTKWVDIDRQLASQYAQLNKLKSDRERYQALEAKDAATRKQVDDLVSQIAVTEREIAAQRQNYERNNAGIREEIALYDVQIAEKDDQLSKCRIVAPIDGTVLTKFAEAGELVTSGKSLFKLADLKQVYVRAYLTTAQLAEVKLGDTVQVTIEDGTDKPRTYEGRLVWIADEAEFTPKNIQTKDERADLVYAAKIALDNDGYLKLGMYAYVRFQ
ncbi:HlyD family secretion protein [Barnesiella viscericola]|uniref:Efflux RND transporter periplasmic adaptor subunit n=1 Tax=Barnesiella viscericola TaxID=397865 RepID=A0A921MRK6_9BACT|nr:HlyD family efflux transporter periplasmic adaptor subunit [Barnesiella viscericola]HJG89538.1 efflux RND transporter periplasmic adaptor subunit [Barnesiella viscericola]